jgi:predicted enzyme related to lactoylglutathione lyase
MTIKNALAGIAVKDLERAIRWYQALLGRSPDSRPMSEVAEWEFSGGGWMQVFEDGARAGSSSVTLVESNLDERLKDLKAKGIAIGPTTSSDFVKTAIVSDLDGNQIVFAEARSDANRAAR